MLLTSVTIQFFRNFVGAQTVRVEDDLTVFVGKNESGKTTILKALHRLNPANREDATFDLRTEYPRWRLAADRRRNPQILDLEPVSAQFRLDEADCEHLGELLPAAPPVGSICTAARSYGGTLRVEIRADLMQAIDAAAARAGVGADYLEAVRSAPTLSEAGTAAKALARGLKGAPDQAGRSKALTSFASAILDYAYLLDGGAGLDDAAVTAISERVPRFFYFSDYENLPGQCDLTRLAAKLASGAAITPQERTVVALLAHADEEPKDFLDEDYDSRKAELQAASVDLSSRAFEYWGNKDLTVVFDTDNVRVEADSASGDPMHRLLKIQLRDGRHGGVETNFETRSAGFRWFFSFFAAFSEFQDSVEQLIVLLDEPGTSLHGDAQSEFVRFVSEELAVAKQTLYTTHSQHMVDPTRYERLRAVHDRATRENPDLAVVVTAVDLSADRDTLLPIEAALGHAVSQHLFLDSGQHLAVARISDLIYLQRMTEHLWRTDGGLNPRLTIIPVGGAGNLPAFVALMGRHRALSALVDNQGLGRIRAAAEANGVPLTSLVACADVDASLPRTADLEDLFAVGDYLKLYNWAFGTRITSKEVASTAEPIRRRIEDALGPFDHARPAHALTEHRTEFFAGLEPMTIDRFRMLFTRLNATLRPSALRTAITEELRELSDPRTLISAREIRRVAR